MTADEPAFPLAPEIFTLRRALFEREEEAAALARRLAETEEEVLSLRAELARLRPLAAAAAPLPAPPPARFARRVLRALWRLARPLVRPLAWRARTFLFEPTRQGLADLQAAETRLAEALEALARNTSASGPVAERIAGIADTLEAALLTVALSPGPVCDPPAATATRHEETESAAHAS